MATIGQLVVDFSANSSSFARDMSSMRRSLKTNSTAMNRTLISLEKSWMRVGAGMKKSARGLLDWRKGLVALTGAGGIAALTNASLAYANQLSDVSNKLGLSTEKLQAYRFGALQVGVASNTLDMAMQRFIRRLGEAQQGTGELLPALEGAEISLKTQSGQMRTAEAVLGDYADAIMNAGTQQEALRLAFKAFDSEGAALVAMFRNGADGMQRMEDRARSLGIIMDEALVRKAGDAKVKLQVLGELIRTRVTVAIIENADQINKLAAAFANAIPKALAFMRSIGLVDPTAQEKLKALNEQITDTSSKLAKLGGTGRASMRRAHGAEIDRLKQELKDLLRERRSLEAEMLRTPLTTPTPVVADEETAAPFVPSDDGKDGGRKRTFGDYLKRIEDNRKRYEAGLKSEAETIRTQTLTAQEAHAESMERLNLLRERGFVSQQTYERGVANANAILDDATEKTRLWADAFDQVGQASNRALEGLVLDGKNARDVMSSLLNDISRVILRSTTSGLGSSISTGLSSLFGGFRAEGGPVQAGMSYIVGENGPERFTASASGHITPNDQLGGAGGHVINIDARGAAPGVGAEIRAVVTEVLAQQGPAMAVRSVEKALRSGGSFSRLVGAQ